MTSRRAALLSCLALGLLLACDRREAPRGPVERAELGVFFGGQVQERKEIPFSVDRTKQTWGFRLTFREPLRKTAELAWEIDRPGPRGRGRAVELGDAKVRVGQSVFDQEIVMKPGDPLGTWNVRVLVDGEVVIDRSLGVYDAAARRREQGPVLSKQKRKD